MAAEERRRIAYHEAGHAYAAVKLLSGERLTKVTIVRHGNALGFAAWKPEEERHTRTEEELRARLQVSLASRAAEELFLGTRMSGVTGDLQSATILAGMMVGAYGMDQSLFSYLPFGGVGAMQEGKARERIEALLDAQFAQVKVLLEANRAGVAAIAEALILRSELNDLDVAAILAEVEAVHPFVQPALVRAA